MAQASAYIAVETL